MKILDVGQCGVDGPRMKLLFREKLGATVVNASTLEDAAQKIESGGYDIVLINRILAADGSEGSELIKKFSKQSDAPPMMLVSDHDEAQQQAVAMGAKRGFGKSALEEPETLELIREAAKK